MTNARSTIAEPSITFQEAHIAGYTLLLCVLVCLINIFGVRYVF